MPLFVKPLPVEFEAEDVLVIEVAPQIPLLASYILAETLHRMFRFRSLQATSPSLVSQIRTAGVNLVEFTGFDPEHAEVCYPVFVNPEQVLECLHYVTLYHGSHTRIRLRNEQKKSIVEGDVREVHQSLLSAQRPAAAGQAKTSLEAAPG